MTLSSPECRAKTRLIIKLLIPIVLTTTIACKTSFHDPTVASGTPNPISIEAININTAGSVELRSLPGIGPRTAQKIMEHRTRFGPFRKPAQLMLVDGIGEKQFLKIRTMIKTR